MVGHYSSTPSLPLLSFQLSDSGGAIEIVEGKVYLGGRSIVGEGFGVRVHHHHTFDLPENMLPRLNLCVCVCGEGATCVGMCVCLQGPPR